MIILVADTSVLIDLERADLLGIVFQSGDTFATPDFLYQTELALDLGPELLGHGLQILTLTAAEMTKAQTLKSANTKLSLSDCAAYVGAQRPDHELLSGDGALRTLAASEGMTYHGVLWVMDRMHASKAATPAQLHAGLTKLANHPRCRLPANEVQSRLNLWTP